MSALEDNHKPNKKRREEFLTIKLPCKDSNDKLLSATFSKFVSENRSIASSDSNIIMTDLMAKLYEEATKWSEMSYTLVSCFSIEGPPGAGKTTAVYWLYHQFRNDKQHVMSIPVPLNDEHFTIAVDTLNNFSNPKVLFLFSDFRYYEEMQWHSFDNFFRFLRTKPPSGCKVCFIFSLSSAFKMQPVFIRNSSLRTLLQARKRFMFKAMPYDDLLSVAKQSRITLDRERYDMVGGMPRFLLLLNACNDDKHALEEKAMMEWQRVIKYIERSCFFKEDHRCLFIALKHRMSLKLFEGLHTTCEHLVPVMANLVTIDKEFVPHLIINRPENLLDRVIKLFQPYWAVDNEERVIGYIFKRLGMYMFSDLYIENCLIGSDPSSAQEVHIEMTPSDIRVDYSFFEIGRGVIYRTQKSAAFGIDGVGILQIDQCDTLLIVRMSVQQSNHKEKVGKILIVDENVYKLRADSETEPPQHVLYLYVNPYCPPCGANYSAMFAYFTSLYSKRETGSGATQLMKKRSYAQVSSQSLSKVLTCYHHCKFQQ
jgi:hypothetical protein